MYYYGARYLNPTSSVWYGVDPLAEKMPAYSAYVYCLANPVKLVDPTGMIWEDPKDAEKLKTRIDKRIERINQDNTKLQAKIDRGGLSDKKLARLEGRISEGRDRIANLHKSKADIDLLGADQEHVYALSQISGGIHTVRSGEGNKVYIETSSDALSIHEITHVRQSLEAGGLRFMDGKLLNVGTSERSIAKMEIEAYQMQYSYDKSFPGAVSSLKDINIQSVGNIKNDKGDFVYPGINRLHMNALKQQKLNKKMGF